MVEENIGVTRFREYLRIKTVHPEPDYPGAVSWLTKYAKELKLAVKVTEPYPDRPFVIMTWEGSNPSLPCIFLYSHIDVVPVFPEKWTHDPFSAHKDEKGNIYARGAQDMKCVGVQYMEAIRRMQSEGRRLLRTLQIVWGPDEEITGKLGMAKFIETDLPASLNIGFALDEGIASESDIYKVYYAERCMWWLKITCPGSPGHGSKFIENTAAEKFQKVVNSFLNFREEQRKKLESDPKLTLGDVVSVNMTKIEGGVQLNVVPAELVACFDMRVPPTIDPDALTRQIEGWCTDAGEDVKVEYLNKGYEALGFSPMINTPQLLHDNDEFLNENVFLDGVYVYYHLITELANVPSKQ